MDKLTYPEAALAPTEISTQRKTAKQDRLQLLSASMARFGEAINANSK